MPKLPYVILFAGLVACSSGDDDGTVDPPPPIEPPPSTCTPPITLEDVSNPNQVVGDGTAASCTHAALATAVAAGGVITFDCGGAATIDVTEAISLRIDVDTIVDGNNEIVLDAGGRDRIFVFEGTDYRASDTRVVLQQIRLQNGNAPANDFTPENPNNPACAWGYKDGSGGAISMNDARLHLIDVVFADNTAADTGPDTGGGAVYALGTKEVIAVGCTFTGNRGSNGGAVGLLQTDGVFYNTVFENNRATGRGQNFGGASGCPPFNHDEQGGAGGNGGAIAIDGDSVDRVEFCGVTFRGNQGNELGTVFRTPNTHRGESSFDLCLFENNHAGDGGGAIWMQDMDFTMSGTTLTQNTSDGVGGAIRIDQGPHGSTIRIQNSTFHRNVATEALGGGLVFSGGGLVRNCTFAENRADGGEGFFGAAIVAHGPESQGLRIENTIFADNLDDHEWTPMTCSVDNPGAPVPLPGSGNVQWPQIRNGPNMQEDNPCTVGIRFEDPMLGALTDNGGPTPTMRPPDGSFVIGLGGECPSIDQRGEPRPTTGCAAGAVEP